jgi:tRNA (guanine-N7-)-methyltransferase
MRMRKKPNLVPRMERCSHILLESPETLLGRWRQEFSGFRQLRVELGCGKGRFLAETAAAEPDVLFIAIERVPDAMVVGMERVCGAGLNNVRFMDRDVKTISAIFAPGEVDMFYLNFCDPWPKSRDAKHRLTAPGFLRIYASLLSCAGQIRFKTDNAPLFQWSLEQFQQEGWALSQVTTDLHADGPVGVMTDYEEKFHAQGVKICRLVAAKADSTLDLRTGDPPRLRNASLSDARANTGVSSEVQPST